MLDRMERRLLLGIAAVLLLVFGLWGWQSRKDGQVSAATAKGAVIHDAATAGQAKGEVYDQTIAARDPEVQAAKDRVTKSMARLSKLPKPVEPADTGELAGNPDVSGNPSVPACLPESELVSQLRAENAAQRDAISSLVDYTKALEGKVATQDLSIASWRGTAQARAQELVQANAVIAAQQGLIAGALLKGRLQGLAVGFGSGYAARSLR